MKKTVRNYKRRGTTPAFNLQSEQLLARYWARDYRRALEAPERSVCINPEDPYEEQTFLHADDLNEVVDRLLSLLDRFGEEGSFAPPNVDFSFMVFEALYQEELHRKSRHFFKTAILEETIRKFGKKYGVSSVGNYYNLKKKYSSVASADPIGLGLKREVVGPDKMSDDINQFAHKPDCSQA